MHIFTVLFSLCLFFKVRHSKPADTPVGLDTSNIRLLSVIVPKYLYSESLVLNTNRRTWQRPLPEKSMIISLVFETFIFRDGRSHQSKKNEKVIPHRAVISVMLINK